MLKNRISSCLLFLGWVVFFVAIVSGCSDENNASKTNMQQTFLPVEEAFIFSSEWDGAFLIKARWEIAEGYRLYKDKFKFSVAPEAYQIVDVVYPTAEMFSDKNLGEKASYRGLLEVSIKLSGDKSAGAFVFTSQYQGCADVGLCYPPETKTMKFNSN